MIALALLAVLLLSASWSVPDSPDRFDVRVPARSGAPTAGKQVGVSPRRGQQRSAPLPVSAEDGETYGLNGFVPSREVPAVIAVAVGAPTRTGTASWFGSYGPGFYAAVNSYRWGDPRYKVRVSGPAGTALVTVRDFCFCRVKRSVRLIDVSPAAFRQVCGPLRIGLCKVEVKGMR